MTEKAELRLSFGASSPSIESQLEVQGFSFRPDRINHYQQDADAITRLKIRGLLPESQFDKCYRRLIKKIGKHCESCAEQKTT